MTCASHESYRHPGGCYCPQKVATRDADPSWNADN
jgi:hypothetical protein